MKKLLLSLALLTAVAALHARDRKQLTKEARGYISHSNGIDKLPISDKAKKAEYEHMVNRGNELHDAMAEDHKSHQDLRMPAVKRHAEKHASSLPGRQQGIITQD